MHGHLAPHSACHIAKIYVLGIDLLVKAVRIDGIACRIVGGSKFVPKSVTL